MSPSDSPGVLNQPVRSVVLSSVSDSENSVVSLNRARAWAVNSSDVELESDSGVESNGERSLVVEGVDHLASGDVVVSLNLDNSQGGVELARLLDSSVWVAFPGFDSSVFGQPGVGSVHESSVASFVQLVAINQLLWGEREKLLVDDLVLSLKSGRGREGPAGSARSLVLDISDGTLGNPVVLGGWGGSVSGGGDGLFFFVLFFDRLDFLESGVEVDEFFLGQIGEKSQTVLGGWISLAEFFNLVEVFDEDE